MEEEELTYTAQELTVALRNGVTLEKFLEAKKKEARIKELLAQRYYYSKDNDLCYVFRPSIHFEEGYWIEELNITQYEAYGGKISKVRHKDTAESPIGLWALPDDLMPCTKELYEHNIEKKLHIERAFVTGPITTTYAFFEVNNYKGGQQNWKINMSLIEFIEFVYARAIRNLDAFKGMSVEEIEDELCEPDMCLESNVRFANDEENVMTFFRNEDNKLEEIYASSVNSAAALYIHNLLN